MEAILGQLLAITTAACFAAAANVWSHVGKQVGSNTVTHIRLWLALPFIVLAHFFMTGYIVPLRADASSLLLFLLSGLLGFTVADLFIFRSLLLIGVRQTHVILTLTPIFSTVISWFVLKEALTYLQILGIVVTTGGVMWVIYEEGRIRIREKIEKNKNVGVPFAIAGSLAQALANILSKAGMFNDLPPISGSYLRITGGLAGLVLFSFLRKSFFTDFKRMRKQPKLTALLTAGAFVGPLMGVLLTLYALRLAPVGIVSALVRTSPVLLLPFDYFVLKKKVTYKVVIGTFVAIAGVSILFIY